MCTAAVAPQWSVSFQVPTSRPGLPALESLVVITRRSHPNTSASQTASRPAEERTGYEVRHWPGPLPAAEQARSSILGGELTL